MLKITNNKIIYIGKVKDLLPQLRNILDSEGTLEQYVTTHLTKK